MPNDPQIRPHDVREIERICIGAEFARDPDTGERYAVPIYRTKSEHVYDTKHGGGCLHKFTNPSEGRFEPRGRMVPKQGRKGKR